MVTSNTRPRPRARSDRGRRSRSRCRPARAAADSSNHAAHFRLSRSARKVSSSESVCECFDPAGDVMADQTHAVDPVDAAFGGFVGVPDLDRVPPAGSTRASRPRTMTRSTEAMRSSMSCFRDRSVMSTPTSRRTTADSPLIVDPRFVPAESTVTVSPAIFRMRPAANWDVPPFLTHTNSTDGVVGFAMAIKRQRPGVHR